MNKKLDLTIGIGFGVATILFIIIFMTNDAFFTWAFARHHNVASWYIRPLFIIPMVIFSFKKSYTGIFITIFALFTSMFWFPVPTTSNPQVLEFLAFEMEYLKGPWDAPKIIISLAVPLFFIMLILSAWKRNWKWILGVIISAAVLKFIWSIGFSDSGISILKPALIGVVVCVGGLYYYFEKQKQKIK